MFVQKSSDFTPTPAGLHKAVCIRFVDLGTQESDGPYGHQSKREVMVSFEIPGERVEVDGEDKPCIHNQYFTWSMHEKSNLRQALESWRNTPFNKDDLAGPPNGFNTKNLIGVGCQLQIMHNENGKAKLKGIMPLSKADWPTPEGKPLYFQMQQLPLDMDGFNRLGDYHKGKIQTSPEWAAMSGNTPPGNESYGNGGDIRDDEVPF